MSRAHLLRLALSVILGASLLACASTNQSAQSSTAPAIRGASLVVHNSNTNAVNIYVVSGSTRVRIGTASSMSTSRLTIPAVYLNGGAGVTLLADPLGASVSHTFPPMQIDATDRVELRVSSSLPMSSFGVYAQSRW
jgi:type IV pilus biogenesis protein CpaD/CtpE